MQSKGIKTLVGYILGVIYFLIAVTVIVSSIGSPVFKIVVPSVLVVGVVLWFFYMWLVKYF